MLAGYPGYKAMLDQTNKNYQVATAYYEQKQIAFQKAVAKNSQDTYMAYIDSLIKASQEFNTYVLQRMEDILKNGGTYTASQAKQDKNYGVYLKDLYDNRSRGEGGKMWVNMKQAGYTFEKFMYDRAVSAEQAMRLKNAPEQASTTVYSQWLANHKEFAATTGTKTWGRSDLAYGSTVTGNTITELRDWIDIETTPPEEVSQGTFLLNEIAKQNVDQNVFGFQLKTYRSGYNDKRQQNSKVLEDQITALMHDRSRKRTWNANYAVNYPIYVLSKYLINIINPINVATITPVGLEWTTELLTQYRFYMEVSWNEPTRPGKSTDDRGGGIEVYPSILNKTVLMRQIKSAGGWKGLLATGKLVQSAGYDKSIKVASIRNA